MRESSKVNTDWTFRVLDRPKVLQTWYRWVTPDGEVWCESRNVSKESQQRLKLTMYASTVWEVWTAWREVTDAPLPDPGVLPPEATGPGLAGERPTP